MQYIVVDLEWNQPTSYNSPAFKKVGGKLLFEMIQIGAVRVNEKLEVTDSFCKLIRPIHYTRLHPRIRRITHIEQEMLEEADLFCDVMDEFSAWCGEDCILLTWGCDDISVLDQNMTFFESKAKIAPMYDMQRLFGELSGNSKERKGLKAAMEQLQIQPDEEEMPFHNALNDAYYTALVFATFPEPEKVLNYPLVPRKLQHIEHRKEQQVAIRVKNEEEGLRSATANMPNCPVCGKKFELTESYVLQGDGSRIALSECPNHGLMMSRIRFEKDENGKKVLTRSVTLSDEQSKAYVATKHLQWQRKLAMQAEHQAE